jgi:hypothetical protein
MGHFDPPKYVEVHQRSPALGSTVGSTVGSNQLDILISSRRRQESRSYQRALNRCRLAQRSVRSIQLSAEVSPAPEDNMMYLSVHD